MKCVDDLTRAFNAAWPRARRQSGKYLDFDDYRTGVKFLKSLADSVARATETDNEHVFDGSYKFQGSSVAELINHMQKYGLEFSRPQSGDEGFYKQQLFVAMRNIYKQFSDVNFPNG